MKTETRRIVLGIGPKPDAASVSWASKVARANNVPLHLIHAYQRPAPYSDAVWAQLATDSDFPNYAVLAETTIAEALRSIDTDLDSSGQAIVGYPAQVLLEAAEDALMVVVGSRRRGAAASMVLGSVGNAVAARAVCPAVVVRGAEPDIAAEAPVVVGVDGSQLSESALAFGFDHASRTHLPLLAVMCWWPVGSSTQGLSDPWLQNYREDTERWLAECVAGWQEKYPDVSVTRQVIVEPPAKGLADIARHASLLVVGAHSQNKGPRSASFLGSVTQGVLHQLDRPIAILHS